MEKFEQPLRGKIKHLHKKRNWYLISMLLLIFILPLFSILLECTIKKNPVDPGLIGKWSIFWTIGIRLFAAGIKQVFDPAFTATRIFHMKSKESFVVIRELGFANISIGIMGTLSIINSEWRQIAGIAGAIFFGLAGVQHFFRKPATNKQMAAMISDLLLFTVMLLYVFFTLSSNYQNP